MVNISSRKLVVMPALALILLCYLASFSSCEEADSNMDTKITDANAGGAIAEDSEAAAPSGIDTLTETKCSTKRKGCCEHIYLPHEDEELTTKCFTLHQSKLPKEVERDPQKLFKFLSCFVECYYKQRKYIGKGDNINMPMVKADAEKKYHDRPKEKAYHIKTYDFCRKDALTMYNIIKSNPAEYHKKKTCPYFRWESKPKTSTEAECAAAQQKCYEIDGIHI